MFLRGVSPHKMLPRGWQWSGVVGSGPRGPSWDTFLGRRRHLWWKSHMGTQENPSLTHHARAFRRDFSDRCSAFLGVALWEEATLQSSQRTGAQQAGKHCHWGAVASSWGQWEWPSLTELFNGAFLPARHSAESKSAYPVSPGPYDPRSPSIMWWLQIPHNEWY